MFLQHGSASVIGRVAHLTFLEIRGAERTFWGAKLAHNRQRAPIPDNGGQGLVCLRLIRTHSPRMYGSLGEWVVCTRSDRTAWHHRLWTARSVATATHPRSEWSSISWRDSVLPTEEGGRAAVRKRHLRSGLQARYIQRI